MRDIAKGWRWLSPPFSVVRLEQQLTAGTYVKKHLVAMLVITSEHGTSEETVKDILKQQIGAKSTLLPLDGGLLS